jgi:WD40 repeat protein
VTAPRDRADLDRVQRVTIPAYPTALAWSPTGALLAVAGDHGAVELIDATTGTIARRIPAHAGPIQAMAWHPRQPSLITAGQDGAARLWESPFDAPIELLGPGPRWADHACWSVTGERAAVTVGGRAHVFSRASRIAITPPAATALTGAAFTPDGAGLGVAGYGGVRVFDATTGRITRTLAWNGSLLSIAFAPNGRAVAGGCLDHSVHCWRLPSGSEAHLGGYPAKPRRVAFSHDSRWLATAGDTAISVWPFDKQGPSGRRPVQLEGHQAIVTELVYAPGLELLLSGDRDGTVALWAPPKRTTPVARMRLAGKVTQVAWGGSGAGLRWAAADEHGVVLLGPARVV